MLFISMEKKIYTRQCPNCNKPLFYGYKQSYWKAQHTNRWCASCRSKERSSRPECRKILVENGKDLFGEKNPFYGKRHSQKTKDLIRKNTPVRIGKDSPCYKKSVYRWWVEKYGEEIANNKMEEAKKKWSIASSGKNNPMYGRPSPNGSGNGWSGRYNGWFFRSFRELSYMINFIEKNNWSWESGEARKYKILYTDWEGKKRNYYPDFIVNGSVMVECKPKKLHGSVGVLSKKEAAETYCSTRGLAYELVDPGKLDSNTIKTLHDEGKMVLLDRYERKYNERYL